MSAIKISHHENDNKGVYSAVLDNSGTDDMAEMTYSRLNEHHIIIDHTEVPEAFRGQGVGLALITYVVKDARAKGFKITPLCPFVRAMFAKHQDWQDVLA